MSEEAPEGYKPVRCSDCDRQLGWVKEEVMPGTKMRSKDALLMDGTTPLAGTKTPQCPDCPPERYGTRLKISESASG